MSFIGFISFWSLFQLLPRLLSFSEKNHINSYRLKKFCVKKESNYHRLLLKKCVSHVCYLELESLM